MIKRIIKFFDHLEDNVRHRLSRHPTLYALIGGIGVVLFWRGIWDLSGILIGPWTALILSIIIMLLTGTFVSFFIGEQIILSGLREEKRIDEKTEEEVKREGHDLQAIKKDIEVIKEIVQRDHLQR